MFNTAAIALSASFLVGLANAHLAPWAPGMYCSLGNTGSPDLNSYAIVKPLYQLPFDQWWMHHVDNCDAFPPPEGEFLEIPAGGSFNVEIASNRAKTTLSYGNRDTSDWPDGAQYPEDYHVDSCIISPNMHTQNQANAAGTAFAIAYKSDIKSVTPGDLTVFSVLEHTPWKRVSTYQAPAALPACPEGGCICAWGWVPNGCGQPNMYMVPFKCKVTGATSTTPVASPKPPVWCENQPGNCTPGAKQMVFWNQADGNNIVTDGLDASGQPKSPGYNMKLGFAPGAQNNIFAGGPSAAPATPAAPAPNTPAQNTNTGNGNTNTGNGNTGPASGNSNTGAGSNTGDGNTGAGSSSPSATGASSTSDSSSSSAPLPSTTKKSTAKSCKKRSARRALEAQAKRSLTGVSSHHHRRQANHVF